MSDDGPGDRLERIHAKDVLPGDVLTNVGGWMRPGERVVATEVATDPLGFVRIVLADGRAYRLDLFVAVVRESDGPRLGRQLEARLAEFEAGGSEHRRGVADALRGLWERRRQWIRRDVALDLTAARILLRELNHWREAPDGGDS